MTGSGLDKLRDEIMGILQDNISELSKLVIVGTIVPYGGESEPGNGWLLCDGRSLDRGKYNELYGVIGANFGAPDDTHFNLPDLRGRFVRGVDNSPEKRDPDGDARVASALGGHTGRKVGSIQDDMTSSHVHWMYTTGNNTPGGDYNWGFVQGDQGFCTPNAMHSRKTAPFGGCETRPKNIYVNWIIYAGVKIIQ